MIKILPSKFVTFITKTLLLPCTNIMYFHARGRYICTWHLKRDVKGYPCSYFYSMQNSDRNWLIIRWISYVLRYVTKCFPTLYKLTKMIHISFLRLSVPLVKKGLQKVWFTFPFLRQTLHFSSFRSFAKDRCTRRRSCTRCNISWNIDSLQHPRRKLVSSSPLVRLYLGFFMDAAALSAGLAQQ